VFVLCRVRRGEKSPCTGVQGQRPREKKIASGKRVVFCLIFHVASIFVSIVGRFFGTWFFSNGFLFLIKELGLLTNPSHWVRVLDVIGSYMYIVL
jgi:hypothetical protein